jgi:MSHA biogenesis protein MshP
MKINKSIKLQTGFTLVTAVFILIVLSLGSVFIIQAASVANATTQYALQGRHAYFGAYSGAEWALHKALKGGSCAASTAFNFPTGGTSKSGLNGYRVTVNCVSESFTEGADTYNIYEITSTTERGTVGDIDYAARTLIVKATDNSS